MKKKLIIAITIDNLANLGSKSVERFKYLFENSIKTQAEYQNLFSLKNSIWNNRKEIKELFLSTIALKNKQETKSYEGL